MEIHVHLGAHKTATTYIQTVLRQNIELLRSASVAPITPAHGFRRLLATIRRYGDFDLPETSFDDYLSKTCSLMASDLERLLVSEENFLPAGRPFAEGGRFYPWVSKKIELVKWLFGRDPDVVYISVRHYRDFFPALYFQHLNITEFNPVDAALHQRLLNLPRGWRELIQDIRRELPNTRVIVWPYEGFIERKETFMKLLIGRELPLQYAEGKRRQTPNFETYAGWIEALEKDERTKLDYPKFSKWARKHADHENGERFADGFWGETSTLPLTRRYFEDLEWLEQKGLLFDPDAENADLFSEREVA